MRRSITIGRWRLDQYQRAIYLTRGPNPRCPDCYGDGGIEVGYRITEADDVDYDTVVCGCWNPGGWRISLWPQARSEFGIACPCGDTDGPFEQQPGGWLCEHCVRQMTWDGAA